MYTVYLLVNLPPPSYELSNLNFAALKSGSNASVLASMIMKCPPDLIFASGREDLPGNATINDAIAMLPNYKKVASVPVSQNRDYGLFSGDLYSNIDRLSIKYHESASDCIQGD